MFAHHIFARVNPKDSRRPAAPGVLPPAADDASLDRIRHHRKPEPKTLPASAKTRHDTTRQEKKSHDVRMRMTTQRRFQVCVMRLRYCASI